MKLLEEIQKTLQEFDLSDGTDKMEDSKALLPIIKKWALEMIGDSIAETLENERMLSYDPHDQDIYTEGFNDAKKEIIEKIDLI